MKADPILDEIHRIRADLLKSCDGDLTKLMDRLKEAEKNDGHRLVSKEDIHQGTKIRDTAVQTRHIHVCRTKIQGHTSLREVCPISFIRSDTHVSDQINAMKIRGSSDEFFA